MIYHIKFENGSAVLLAANGVLFDDKGKKLKYYDRQNKSITLTGVVSCEISEARENKEF